MWSVNMWKYSQMLQSFQKRNGEPVKKRKKMIKSMRNKATSLLDKLNGEMMSGEKRMAFL